MVLETTQAVLKTVEQLQRSVQSLQSSLDNHSSKLDMVTTQAGTGEQLCKTSIRNVSGEARGDGGNAGSEIWNSVCERSSSKQASKDHTVFITRQRRPLINTVQPSAAWDWHFPNCSFVSQSPSPLSTGGGSSLARRSPLKNGIMSPSQLIFPFNLRNLTSFQSFQS